MSGAGFAGALTAGDEYPGRDAEVEAPASADYQAAYTWTPIEVDVISATGANHVARAILAAGYTRRPAPGGVPVEALRALLAQPDDVQEWELYDCEYHDCPGCEEPHLTRVEVIWSRRLRALIDSAPTDGGES